MFILYSSEQWFNSHLLFYPTLAGTDGHKQLIYYGCFVYNRLRIIGLFFHLLKQKHWGFLQRMKQLSNHIIKHRFLLGAYQTKCSFLRLDRLAFKKGTQMQYVLYQCPTGLWFRGCQIIYGTFSSRFLSLSSSKRLAIQICKNLSCKWDGKWFCVLCRILMTDMITIKSIQALQAGPGSYHSPWEPWHW